MYVVNFEILTLQGKVSPLNWFQILTTMNISKKELIRLLCIRKKVIVLFRVSFSLIFSTVIKEDTKITSAVVLNRERWAYSGRQFLPNLSVFQVLTNTYVPVVCVLPLIWLGNLYFMTISATENHEIQKLRNTRLSAFTKVWDRCCSFNTGISKGLAFFCSSCRYFGKVVAVPFRLIFCGNTITYCLYHCFSIVFNVVKLPHSWQSPFF